MTDLLLLPGDGIGPEVIGEVKKVAARLAPELSIAERAFGGRRTADVAGADEQDFEH